MSGFDAEFARRSRERCQPVECTGGPLCWVALGTSESLGSQQTRAPRCTECSGKIRQERWLSPFAIARGRAMADAAE